ncbi:MAG: ABC transporter permease subunit [Phycisphaerales bacterium]|nr:MAG: ABC transporter permease subunit [Phycisphaerales bacterium]
MVDRIVGKEVWDGLSSYGRSITRVFDTLELIVEKEIRHNFFSYKFSIITVLTTILILVSIFVMYRDYGLARENYDILESLSSTAEDRSVVIPPTPLSIFAKGLDENLCRSHGLGWGRRISASSKQQSVNDLFKLFTTPDLLYVIKVVLSLCAMLFAVDMVSGEKETGTLRQSLSGSLGRPILIIGKWIGGFVSIILPLFIAVLLGTAFVTLQPSVEMSPQNWARLGLFLLSSVVYLAVFFSLGLLISCLTHQTSSSLVVSLFAWTILVFLIPNLGNILARQLVQIPTVQQLELKRLQIAVKRQLVANQTKDYRERMEWLGRCDSEQDQLTADYRNRFDRLVTLSQNITRISPTASFTFLATDLMGTGILEEGRLKSAVMQYVFGSGNDEDRSRPSFSYQRASCREVLGRGGLNNLLILVLVNLLFFAATYVAFLRYDVR